MLCTCYVAGGAPAWADDAPLVEAVTVTPATWRNAVRIVAHIEAQQDAALAAQRAGQITQVLYQSGQNVAAGALLVKLNDAPEQAQLSLDRAKQGEAKDALARAEKLMSINGASRAALEQAEADAAEATAQVTADQAAVAELSVVAPFAGTLGIRSVSAGDYVTQGQVVAQITQATPLRVLFSVPQTEAGHLAVGDGFDVLAPLAAAGRITALSPDVDATTNARAAEGVLDGDPAGLVPGSFATIELATGPAEPAFAVPETALNDSVVGQYIYAVQSGPKGDVLRTVYVKELGLRDGQAIIGTADLQAGTKIIAIGGFKLSDGAAVRLAP